MEQFIDGLPEPYRTQLQTLLVLLGGIATAVGTFSAAIVALKPVIAKLIGEPSDLAPGWKRAVWGGVAFLEKYVAWNTRTVADRKAREVLNQTQSIPAYKPGGDL